MRSAPTGARVMLPFRFTAQVSLDDAAKLAAALGIRYEVCRIADGRERLEKILAALSPACRGDIIEKIWQAAPAARC